METNNLLDFSRFENSLSKFNAQLGTTGGNINFSNSGKGGDKKYFTLSLDSFVSILKDIKDNLLMFKGHENYMEKEWRDLGSSYYSDGPANAMSTVQTKPLFSTLSKIIKWANMPALQEIDPEQTISLSEESVTNAIEKLSRLADRFSPESNNEVEQKNEDKDIVIEENTSIRDFSLSVFNYFYKNNWAQFFDQTKSKFAKLNSNSFISHDFDSFKRLVAEFPTNQTKDELSSSGTLRFFEEPIYQGDNRFFYFSTQWFGIGDESLSFQNLKNHFEFSYPNYKLEKIDKTFRLIKKGLTQFLSFDYKLFHRKIKEAGLMFSEKIVSRFVASLCTKPFVICSGLSGSGKTKLAQSFVQWICEDENQYKIIPVGADWTNREPLLGFPNGLDQTSYIFPDSGALQIILNSVNPSNVNKPYFLILDEMNLSHVERYFADFLSIMESHDNIKLYSGAARGTLQQEIGWPKNLFIIGTVNIDETTYMFSPKVLDRANVIEFRISEKEIQEYLDSQVMMDMSKFYSQSLKKGFGASMAISFLNIAKERKPHVSSTNESLVTFFKELKKSGAEFGYRSASEINRLIMILDRITKDDPIWDGSNIEKNDFMDISIMQKLLPKLHGSRSKLTKILPILGGLCLINGDKIREKYFDKFESTDFGDENIKYKISFEKICRMYRNAVENGYASYAEA